MLAFVERGEVPPAVAVDVLNLVYGQQQGVAVPPAHCQGLAQQLVQRQIFLYAQLEAGAALHGSANPREGAADLPPRPSEVRGHGGGDAAEQRRGQVGGTRRQFVRHQGQVNDRRRPMALVRHGLSGELAQQTGLADALDAVDEQDAVFRVLLANHDSNRPCRTASSRRRPAK